MSTTVELPATLKLPITDLQRGYLENAEGSRDVRLYSAHTILWGSKNGLVNVTPPEPGVVRYARLTALGRVLLAADREHGFTIRSVRLGGSPVKGLPDHFGTTLRCRCRAAFKTNESRRNGGERELMERYRTHLRAILATMIDEEI